MDVMKFGVVSVGEAQRLREMARLVKEAHAEGRALVGSMKRSVVLRRL